MYRPGWLKRPQEDERRLRTILSPLGPGPAGQQPRSPQGMPASELHAVRSLIDTILAERKAN